MAAVRLRGVNRSGFEYSVPGVDGFLAAAAISEDEIREIVQRWGCEIIRLPFNQDWVLNGCGSFSGETYMQALDQVIDWAAAMGAYTILDLQWLDASTKYGHTSADGEENHVAPLPEPATLNLWSSLAERYREEAAVLFDLLNEPHDPLDDDNQPKFLIDSSGMPFEAEVHSVGPDEWLPWAARLIDEIRRVHSNSLLLLSGLDWGYDLQHVFVDTYNLVYSTHVYPIRKSRDWKRAFGHAASTLPVFIGEWGGGDNDVEWGTRFLSCINKLGLGWTAWSWTDRPFLVTDARRADYRPTVFGRLVQSQLADPS
jgi:endoglucanase